MTDLSRVNRRTVLAITAGALTGCVSESGEEPTAVNGDGGGGGDGSANGDGSEGQGDGSSDEQTEAEAVVGEIVSDDEIELVVSNVRSETSLGMFSEADPGNEFVVVEVAIKNVSDEFITVSNLLQTRLRDSEGFSYTQTFVGEGNTFNDGQLAPGEVERGEVAFEVPQDASGLTFTFDFQAFAVFDFDRVVINLEQEASETEEVEQNLRENVFDVGETVEFNDVEVTVHGTETQSSLGQFTQAESGNEYVIVDIEILNGTDEQRTISTILQMLLKDGEGWSYQEDLMATSQLTRNFDEGTPLALGENRRGRLAYEVEQGLSPLYWVFEFTLWTEGDKTFWKLR